MSAILMRCKHCGEGFVAGVVGTTPWPEHICPDGTRNAAAEFSTYEEFHSLAPWRNQSTATTEEKP